MLWILQLLAYSLQGDKAEEKYSSPNTGGGGGGGGGGGNCKMDLLTFILMWLFHCDFSCRRIISKLLSVLSRPVKTWWVCDAKCNVS